MSDVAIFWDYENCCPPSNSSGLGYDIVNNIRRIARLFGSVTTFRAYLDISAQSPKSVVLRSELQSSGVSMIDCPHNGKKDVVDKMILVDMLAFAIDHAPPATIVLIAGDRDYAYAASILKLRRYQVILVVPSSPHTSPALESQASLVIDWGVAILRNRSDSANSLQAVRQPYLDLDPALVAKLLGELQEDDAEPAPLLNSTSSPSQTSKLRRVNPRDLLEPSGPDSIDPTQEFNHAAASPKKSTNVANDAASEILPVPKTPSRPRHASVSAGSTRARSATFAAQSPPALGTKNPMPSGTTEITNDTSPSQHGLPVLPSLDTFELPFHDNSSTGEMSVPIKSSTPSSRVLNSSASPFVMTKAPAGLGSIPNPCSAKPASPIIVPAKTLASSVTTEDSDGHIKRSNPYRANVTDYPPYFASPASRRNVYPPNDAPPRNLASPPPMFLGVISDDDDDDDSAQSAVSSQASSALDQSASDSASAPSIAVHLPTSTTAEAQEQNESQRHQNYTIFKPLIHLLLAARENGDTRPSRSTVAMSLVQIDKQAYRRAGVLKFRDYTTLAEEAGIIELGGREADAWIALRPNWFGVGDTMATRPFSSSSSLVSNSPEVIANPSLTGSNNPLMERVATFQPPTTLSPKPVETSNIMPTLETDRQDNTFWTVTPLQFQPLIDLLVHMRAGGSSQTLRSIVGQALGPAVYAQAGVPGFKEYILQALDARVVQCGGVGGHAWIRLHPGLRT